MICDSFIFHISPPRRESAPLDGREKFKTPTQLRCLLYRGPPASSFAAVRAESKAPLPLTNPSSHQPPRTPNHHTPSQQGDTSHFRADIGRPGIRLGTRFKKERKASRPRPRHRRKHSNPSLSHQGSKTLRGRTAPLRSQSEAGLLGQPMHRSGGPRLHQRPVRRGE